MSSTTLPGMTYERLEALEARQRANPKIKLTDKDLAEEARLWAGWLKGLKKQNERTKNAALTLEACAERLWPTAK